MGKTFTCCDDEVENRYFHQRYLIGRLSQLLVAHDGGCALDVLKKKP